MFLELFLERLSCLCEILGRECMQAFCSSWTPNTHNTARSNVIIMFWKKQHCKANWTTLRCPLTPRRERCPGNVVFSSQHIQPTAINHKAPRKNVQPGCQQQQKLTTEGRSQCLRNKGLSVGWLLPLKHRVLFRLLEDYILLRASSRLLSCFAASRIRTEINADTKQNCHESPPDPPSTAPPG